MINISKGTRQLLSLSMMKGVGAVALQKALLLPSISDLTLEDIAAIVPQVARSLSEGSSWTEAQKDAEYQLRTAEKYGVQIFSPLDPDYPRLLLLTHDAPGLLFVRGSFATTPENSVAIIGTRKPTQHGILIAQRITKFFVEKKWSIVSGLALGCDAIAHQTALESGAHTIAVLAHGLHMTSPIKNEPIALDILSSGGALISQFPFNQGVSKAQYVKRDRVQAGLSQGVVMIQSSLNGGSIYASSAALDYERWLAVPYPTEKDRKNSEESIQANILIAEGSNTERCHLLNCDESSLDSIIVLRSRQNYLEMTPSIDIQKPNFLHDDRTNTLLNSSSEKHKQANSTQIVVSVSEELLTPKHEDHESAEPHKIERPLKCCLRLEKNRVLKVHSQLVAHSISQSVKKLSKKLNRGEDFLTLIVRLKLLCKRIGCLDKFPYRTQNLQERKILIQLSVQEILCQMKEILIMAHLISFQEPQDTMKFESTNESMPSLMSTLSLLIKMSPSSILLMEEDSVATLSESAIWAFNEEVILFDELAEIFDKKLIELLCERH